MTDKDKFLAATIGLRGLSALETLSKASPDLEAYLPVRTVISWIQEVQDWSGPIPGTDSVADFKKSLGAWYGTVGVGDSSYLLDSSDIGSVAAAICCSIGAAPGRPELRDIDIARLGKTIDALVKATSGAKGLAAAPLGHTDKIPPTLKAPDTDNKKSDKKKPKKPVIPKPQAPKVPLDLTAEVEVAKTPKMKLTLSEAKTRCQLCNIPQFVSNKFVGCYCFRDLAKSVRTTEIPGGLEITLKGWDEDATITLREALKHE
jgi:ribosomal protein S14